jgi:hypothetical protein
MKIFHVVAVSAFAVVLGLHCGGGNEPPQDPSSSSSSSSSSGTTPTSPEATADAAAGEPAKK